MGGSQPYVAVWGVRGQAPQDAHRTMRALSSPSSPTQHLVLGVINTIKSPSFHHLTSIHRHSLDWALGPQG